MRKAICCCFCVRASSVAQTAPEGILARHDGEWKHVSKQLNRLAEATRRTNSLASRARRALHQRSSTCTWRSQISIAQRHRPQNARRRQGRLGKERHLQSRRHRLAERSLDAVKEAHGVVNAQGLARQVTLKDRDATVDGMSSPAHRSCHEHMGQLVAYPAWPASRPPGSKKE